MIARWRDDETHERLVFLLTACSDRIKEKYTMSYISIRLSVNLIFDKNN